MVVVKNKRMMCMYNSKAPNPKGELRPPLYLYKAYDIINESKCQICNNKFVDVGIPAPMEHFKLECDKCNMTFSANGVWWVSKGLFKNIK